MMADWQRLGIEPTDDPLVIRRAYATRLKSTRVDDDPAGFIALRDAYERRLAAAHAVRSAAAGVPGEALGADQRPGESVVLENPSVQPDRAVDAHPDAAAAIEDDRRDPAAAQWRSIDDLVLEVIADCLPFQDVERALAKIRDRRDTESLAWFARFEVELACAYRDGEPADPGSLARLAQAMHWDDIVHLDRAPTALQDPDFRRRIDDAIAMTQRYRPRPYVPAPWYAWATIVALILAGFGVLAVVFRAMTDSSINPEHNMYPILGTIAALGMLVQGPARAAFNGDPLPYPRLIAIFAGMVAITLYGFGLFG